MLDLKHHFRLLPIYLLWCKYIYAPWAIRMYLCRKQYHTAYTLPLARLIYHHIADHFKIIVPHTCYHASPVTQPQLEYRTDDALRRIMHFRHTSPL